MAWDNAQRLANMYGQPWTYHRVNDNGTEMVRLRVGDGSERTFEVYPDGTHEELEPYNHDAYWKSRYEDDQRHPQQAVVIDNVHYFIAAETNDRKEFRGFGGRKFVIEFMDGRSVTTTNLWYQGPVPPAFRHLFPNNAVRVESVW